MDNTQLARCLQSVGKQVFVRCFWPLRAVALGRLSRAACAQTIINQGHGTELAGALLRISRATAIFEAGRDRHGRVPAAPGRAVLSLASLPLSS